MLWDAGKAVVRGCCMGLSWSVRKQLDEEVTHVEDALTRLEAELAQGADVQRDIETRRQNHTEVIERLRCLNYASNAAHTHTATDKAGRLLARMICQEQAFLPVLRPRSASGLLRTTQYGIHTEFTVHYTRVYKSLRCAAASAIEAFLAPLSLHQLTDEQQAELVEPLALEEVQGTARSLATGKAPGPDGYPAEYYKAYQRALVPCLLAIYQATQEKGALPPTLCESLLVSLPKPNKGTELIGSYQPLALLNTDYKILAKILATRLAPLVPHLVHTDQN